MKILWEVKLAEKLLSSMVLINGYDTMIENRKYIIMNEIEKERMKKEERVWGPHFYYYQFLLNTKHIFSFSKVVDLGSTILVPIVGPTMIISTPMIVGAQMSPNISLILST